MTLDREKKRDAEIMIKILKKMPEKDKKILLARLAVAAKTRNKKNE